MKLLKKSILAEKPPSISLNFSFHIDIPSPSFYTHSMNDIVSLEEEGSSSLRFKPIYQIIGIFLFFLFLLTQGVVKQVQAHDTVRGDCFHADGYVTQCCGANKCCGGDLCNDCTYCYTETLPQGGYSHTDCYTQTEPHTLNAPECAPPPTPTPTPLPNEPIQTGEAFGLDTFFWCSGTSCSSGQYVSDENCYSANGVWCDQNQSLGCQNNCQPIITGNWQCTGVAPECGTAPTGTWQCIGGTCDASHTGGSSCFLTGTSLCTSGCNGTCNSTTNTCSYSCPQGQQCVNTNGVYTCTPSCGVCEGTTPQCGTKEGICSISKKSCTLPGGTCPSGTTCQGNTCSSSCTVTSCNAPSPSCGQTTSGTDNCGAPCSKTGSSCPLPSYTCTQTSGNTCDSGSSCGSGKIQVSGSCPSGSICCASYNPSASTYYYCYYGQCQSGLYLSKSDCDRAPGHGNCSTNPQAGCPGECASQCPSLPNPQCYGGEYRQYGYFGTIVRCGSGTKFLDTCGSQQYCCESQAPPGTPAITSVTQPDGGTTIQTRSITINWVFPDISWGNTYPGYLGWNPSTDTQGCFTPWGYNCNAQGSSSLSFILSVAKYNEGASEIIQTISNIPYTARSYTTPSILTENIEYMVFLCASNGYGAQNCQTNKTRFTKYPYSEGTISGRVGDYISDSSCTTSGKDEAITFSLLPQVSQGVTGTCTSGTSGTPPKTTSFSCRVTLDNVSFDPNPTQSYTIRAVGQNPPNAKYYCNPVNSCGQTSCENGFSLDLDANGGTTTTASTDVSFDISGGGFYKIKNSSYQDRGDMYSFFPQNHLPFDSDDTGEPYLLMGDSSSVGVALSQGTATYLGSGSVSQKEWKREAYTPSTKISAYDFISYVKSRKATNRITTLSDLQEGEINYFKGDMTITDADISSFSNKKITLIVDGALTIGANIIPSSSSLALISQTMVISPSVSQINAILLSNTIDLSRSITPLKIIGNMSATYEAIDTSKRIRTDDRRKPSLFILFDATPFIDLLPQIGIARYEWERG